MSPLDHCLLTAKDHSDRQKSLVTRKSLRLHLSIRNVRGGSQVAAFSPSLEESWKRLLESASTLGKN